MNLENKIKNKEFEDVRDIEINMMLQFQVLSIENFGNDFFSDLPSRLGL